MSGDEIKVSKLGKTWVLDLDGTILKHNGYKIDGHDTFLEGADTFLRKIPTDDMIVFITSRTEDERKLTEEFLNDHDVRYDHIIYDAPYGERILINDKKPSGMVTAYAVNPDRDKFLDTVFVIDDKL